MLLFSNLIYFAEAFLLSRILLRGPSPTVLPRLLDQRKKNYQQMVPSALEKKTPLTPTLPTRRRRRWMPWTKVHDRRIFSLRGGCLYSFEERPMKIASSSLPWTPLTFNITKMSWLHGMALIDFCINMFYLQLS